MQRAGGVKDDTINVSYKSKYIYTYLLVYFVEYILHDLSPKFRGYKANSIVDQLQFS